MSQESCPNCQTTNIKKTGESSTSILYSCINGHSFEVSKKGGVIPKEKVDIRQPEETEILLKKKDNLWDRFKNLLKSKK